MKLAFAIRCACPAVAIATAWATAAFAQPAAPNAAMPLPAGPPYGYPPVYYAPPPAYYAPVAPPAPDPPATATHLGIGYKIGNGFGFLGGDVIVSPVPHIVLDLQANKFSVTAGPITADGYGLAPALQVDIREPGRSTPYIALGYLYTSVSTNGVSDHASGFFVNGGYEWKWSFGMGILVGGGIGYLGDVTINTWAGPLHRNSEMLPMLESSIRFMFL